MPQAMLIDTDTASDDAVALIMALRSESARVIAITTVAGNVRYSKPRGMRSIPPNFAAPILRFSKEPKSRWLATCLARIGSTATTD